jgi:hypothetical protein
MMVGEHPFKSPKHLSYEAKILHLDVKYPSSLTGDAVSILEGVIYLIPKLRHLEVPYSFLNSIFSHLVTLYSDGVNIKKMCVSGLKEDYVCFGIYLFFRSTFL